MMRRKVGVSSYEITDELYDRYEALERTLFDSLTDDERAITVGLFGVMDDVVDCSDEYKQHYTQYSTFNGRHRLTDKDVKYALLYEIEQIRSRLSPQEPVKKDSSFVRLRKVFFK